MFANPWILLGGLNGLIAVGAAALGAHGMKSRTTEQELVWFLQAADFQLWHALLLIGVGALCLADKGRATRLLAMSGMTVQAGILCFSGSLYWLAIAGAGSLGGFHWITPVGGLLTMIGWGLLAVAGWRLRRPT